MEKTKKTGLLFLAFALILGGIAALMTFAVIKNSHKEVSVIIANKDINEGDPLSKTLFIEKKIHPTGKPESAINVEELDLSGTISSKGLLKGDILRQEHLIKLNDSTQELPLISTRVKAIGNDELVGAEIPINSIKGILSGLKKGDMISVVSVIEDVVIIDEIEVEQIVSKLILVNIEVVDVKTKESESKQEESEVVAVALTKEQFKKLSLARDLGTIHVAIQPLGVLYDEEIVEELFNINEEIEIDEEGEVVIDDLNENNGDGDEN